MPNTPISPTGPVPAKGGTEKADTSEPFSMPSAPVTPIESKPSSSATTTDVDTGVSLIVTSKSSDLEKYRLRLSLLAGSLANWLALKKGRAVVETIALRQPNGRQYKAIQITVAIDEAGVEVVESSGKLEFHVVESSGK